MRIATYNIHGWRTQDGAPNLERVAATLAATEADIIGLNEVYYPRVAEGSQQPALAALAARLGMHFVFGPCLRWPAQDDLPAEAYGNALLARWPIIANAAHHLTPVPEREQRGLLEGRILLPDGRTFTVYVTHLDHKDEEARGVQLRAVRTWTVRDRSRPHIVMGDFNAVSPWDMEERPDILDALRAHPEGQSQVPEETGPAWWRRWRRQAMWTPTGCMASRARQSFIPAENRMHPSALTTSLPASHWRKACARA